MRWLHILLVALFVVGTFVFLIQNLEIITLSFLGFSARTRLGFLVVIFYLLGMVTGGSLFGMLRSSVAESGLSVFPKEQKLENADSEIVEMKQSEKKTLFQSLQSRERSRKI